MMPLLLLCFVLLLYGLNACKRSSFMSCLQEDSGFLGFLKPLKKTFLVHVA
jgi:hypothetical protein